MALDVGRFHAVAFLLKARAMKTAETVAKERLCKQAHYSAMAQQPSRDGRNTHARNNKELLDAVFSVRSVLSLYNENQLPSTKREV
jgi:hypothetical protein